MEWDVRNMREHISSYKNACPSQLLATEEERRKKLTISLSLPPGLLQMKKMPQSSAVADIKQGREKMRRQPSSPPLGKEEEEKNARELGLQLPKRHPPSCSSLPFFSLFLLSSSKHDPSLVI
ncbi:hypothetical protein OPV22_018453 [Ensete ventricosum]|uniref:Uncharacterized protein n=1 Tax=Ensete ventricosum TaxID=4639 RepID=A0AAV8QZJ2_ENSVE|nr:hypothetical protein OPV22_018453 [Ensete ventricosum]